MRLPHPRLIAITDLQARGADATDAMVATLCAGAPPGTVAVMLRDKELAVRERLAWAHRLRATTRRFGQVLSIAERLDLALLAAADGLHLGESSVSASDVGRFEAARGLWLTHAWHSPEGAVDAGAHALLLSPVVEARKGRPALGWDGFRRGVERAGGRAVYALGGARAVDVTHAVEQGGAGIAVIGCAYDDPEALLRALK